MVKSAAVSSLTSAEEDLVSLLLNYEPLDLFTLYGKQGCVRCDYSIACYSGFLSFPLALLLQMIFHLHCFIFHQNVIWNALVLFTIFNTTHSSSSYFSFPQSGPLHKTICLGSVDVLHLWAHWRQCPVTTFQCSSKVAQTFTLKPSCLSERRKKKKKRVNQGKQT